MGASGAVPPSASGGRPILAQPWAPLGTPAPPGCGRFASELVARGYPEEAAVDAMLDLQIHASAFSAQDVERAAGWISAKEAAEASLVRLTESDLDDDY